MARPVDRILRSIGAESWFHALSRRLSPTDLQSLLLEVYRQRADAVTPASLLDQYRANRFVQPSPIDPRRMAEVDALAFRLASNFCPIEFAPLAPFGVSAALANLSQNKVVSTARNTEVVAD